MKKSFLALLAVLLFLFGCSTADRTYSVRVVDASGNGIAGVDVIVSGNGGNFQAVTNNSGLASVELPIGFEYTVDFEKEGFVTSSRKVSTISSNITTPVDVVMPAVASIVVPPTATPVPVCGNGILEVGEECDFANLLGFGSTCSSACVLEQSCKEVCKAKFGSSFIGVTTQANDPALTVNVGKAKGTGASDCYCTNSAPECSANPSSFNNPMNCAWNEITGYPVAGTYHYDGFSNCSTSCEGAYYSSDCWSCDLGKCGMNANGTPCRFGPGCPGRAGTCEAGVCKSDCSWNENDQCRDTSGISTDSPARWAWMDAQCPAVLGLEAKDLGCVFCASTPSAYLYDPSETWFRGTGGNLGNRCALKTEGTECSFDSAGVLTNGSCNSKGQCIPKYSLKVGVEDASNGSPLANIQVDVWLNEPAVCLAQADSPNPSNNCTGGNHVVKSGMTDASGFVIFALDETGNYQVKTVAGESYFNDSEEIEVFDIDEDNFITLSLELNDFNPALPPELVPFENSTSAVSPAGLGFVPKSLGKITFDISGSNFSNNAVVFVDGVQVGGTAVVEVSNSNWIEVTFKTDDYFYSIFPEANWIFDLEGNYYNWVSESQDPVFVGKEQDLQLSHTFSVVNPTAAGSLAEKTGSKASTAYLSSSAGSIVSGNNCPSSPQITRSYPPALNFFEGEPSKYNGVELPTVPIVKASGWGRKTGICGGSTYYTSSYYTTEFYAPFDLVVKTPKFPAGTVERKCIYLGKTEGKVEFSCDSQKSMVYESFSKTIENPHWGRLTFYFFATPFGAADWLVTPIYNKIKYNFVSMFTYDFVKTTTTNYSGDASSRALWTRTVQDGPVKSWVVEMQGGNPVVKPLEKIEYNDTTAKRVNLSYFTTSNDCKMPVNRFDSSSLFSRTTGWEKVVNESKKYVGNSSGGWVLDNTYQPEIQETRTRDVTYKLVSSGSYGNYCFTQMLNNTASEKSRKLNWLDLAWSAFYKPVPGDCLPQIQAVNGATDGGDCKFGEYMNENGELVKKVYNNLRIFAMSRGGDVSGYLLCHCWPEDLRFT